MAGTRTGGIKASKRNKELYGEDFYKNIGSTGGKAKVPKGFAVNIKLASTAGRRGGKISRRRKRTR